MHFTQKVAELLKKPFSVKLDLVCLEISGLDAGSYLQGQVTNDLELLECNRFITAALLERTGLIVSQFLIYKVNENQSFRLLVDASALEKTTERLEMYLISEDASIKVIEKAHYFRVGGKKTQSGKVGVFCGEEGELLFEAPENEKLEDLHKLELIRYLSGYPLTHTELNKPTLFNNSSLINFAYSSSKGCFPGNETVSKVESRKGAGLKESLLIATNVKEENLASFESNVSELNTLRIKAKKAANFKSYYLSGKDLLIKAELLREYRVEGKELLFDDFDFGLTYVSFPYYQTEMKHIYFYDLAVEYFKEGHDLKAVELFKLSIRFKEDFADAYESLAVLLGRLEKFEEAINYLNKLLDVDPSSSMAHTNLSMFFMKLGNIDEAEHHKSEATLKSFQKFGEEAALKKKREELLEKERNEREQKEKMFLEVLEIDEEDALANYGLAEISYARNDFKKAQIHLNRVLETDSNYSVAYLLSAKTHIALGNNEKAIEVLNKGITIAAKNGNMMPANEMQNLLSNI